MGEVSRGNPFGSVQVQRSPCNSCHPDNDYFRDEQNLNSSFFLHIDIEKSSSRSKYFVCFFCLSVSVELLSVNVCKTLPSSLLRTMDLLNLNP